MKNVLTTSVLSFLTIFFFFTFIELLPIVDFPFSIFYL